VAFLLVAIVEAGCRSAPPDADATASGAETDPTRLPEGLMPDATSDSLRLDLVVPTQVAAGEPVEMTLRVENVAGRPLDLYLVGRTIAFDLVVEDSAGEEIWSRLHDQVLQQILRLEHLAPGETLVLEGTWPQRSNAGSPVGPGEYQVRGEILAEGGPLLAGPVPLRIAGG
jgi:hypothetical protein